MYKFLSDVTLVVLVRAEQRLGRAKSPSIALAGQSRNWARLVVIVLALTVVAGEAMAKIRPWAI